MNSKNSNTKVSRTGGRTVSPARRVAFEILSRVEEQGSYASILLAEREPELRPDDRSLCHELVLGVLRWRLWLDSAIEHFSGRKVETLDLPVALALRLGLYQLRFLSRIPPSAAVNESVNIAYLARVRSASGFINAVLRRALREPHFDPAAAISDPIEQLAVATSHPPWLIEQWVAQFGFDHVREFAASNNNPAPVAFRISLHADKDAVLTSLRAAGARLVQSDIAPNSWKVLGGGVELRELTEKGNIYIQDEASQLVPHLLDVQPYQIVLDACAAPGSKTTLIAGLADDRARIFAGDLNTARLRLVGQAAGMQGLRSIQSVALDAENLPFLPRSFDRVLVDAPCSGTGTLRRNPEIRWRITNADVSALSHQQLRILESASRTLKPGGRLIYSTCSVEKDENELVVERFLKHHPEFFPISPSVGSQSVSEQGCIRIWPHLDGADGFFAAAIERASGA
jgi:16S rRNA (cytosine967-C5)-methyltransferase